MKKQNIKIGYELNSGIEVKIPLAHTVITGLTKETGKTTCIMGLIKRSGLKALIIKTKIGEKAITEGTVIPPFYKEDFDWEYASDLLEASRKEKMRFERSWIIKYSEGACNILEFKRNIDNALLDEKLKDWDRRVLITLQAYLEKIVPELQYAPLSKTLDLKDGINIMDLERFKEETQNLIIRSVLNEILNKEKNCIIVIPECWKYLAEKYNSPVKRPAEAFIRQGATNNNYLFLDSMPYYEVLMIKHNGKIDTITFEDLFHFEGEVKHEGHHDVKLLKNDVYTLDSNGSSLVWKKINKIFRHNYNGKILTINTLDGLIDVSPNHPLIRDVKSKQMILAKNLKIGDRLQTRRPNKKWHIHNNDDLFIGNENLSWLLGFFCAEGWIHNGHICFSNNNKKLIEKAKNCIIENFHRQPCITTPRKGVYTIDNNSPAMVEYFKIMCYTKNDIHRCRTKKVPEMILNAPIIIKNAFLNGYLEGDGSFDRNGKYWKNFSTSSRSLAFGIIELLNAINTNNRIYCSVHIRKDKKDAISIVLNKKHNVKERGIVKKIYEKRYKGYLYDIEVDSKKHHFYMGIGNIRVHNSQDITNVAKVILKQVSNWILGYQREINEIERTLDQIPMSKKDKPKSEDIATLKLGQFYVATSEFTKKIYAQPIWLNDKIAIKVAKGEINVSDLEQPTYIAPYQILSTKSTDISEIKTGTITDYPEIKKIITELRNDFISNRNDFFTKFEQINETISKIYSDIFNLKQNAPKIDEDEIVMRVLQKIPMTTQSTPDVNVDSIVNQVITRMPKGVGNVVYEVAPLEKITKDFLQEAKQRILDEINRLSDEQKKSLKFAEAKGQTSKKEIYNIGLGNKGGYAGGGTFDKGINEMIHSGLMRKDTHGNFFGNIKERIIQECSSMKITEQEINQLHNHILMELLK